MTKSNEELDKAMIKSGLKREEVILFLKNSSLFTDKFFSLCLKNKDFNPMQYLIRLLLNNDKIVITNVVGQYQITSSGGKITVFDAYGEEIKTIETIDPKTQQKTTEEIKIRYNIEIQRVSAGADPKRARFYSATFDAENLGKKQDYKDLTESYIIFITEHDVFKKGQTIYYVDRYIEWKDKEEKVIGREPFNDGAHIIYVNASLKGKKNLPKEKLTELERALHDLHCIDYRDMYCEELREPVKYLKETKEGETFMLDFFEQEIQKAKEETMKEMEAKIKEIEKARKAEEKARKAEEKARKAEEKARKQAEKQAKQAQKQGKLEGMAEAVINNIRSLMETMNITAENAMNALKIPQEKHEFYLAQL